MDSRSKWGWGLGGSLSESDTRAAHTQNQKPITTKKRTVNSHSSHSRSTPFLRLLLHLLSHSAQPHDPVRFHSAHQSPIQATQSRVHASTTAYAYAGSSTAVPHAPYAQAHALYASQAAASGSTFAAAVAMFGGADTSTQTPRSASLAVVVVADDDTPPTRAAGDMTVPRAVGAPDALDDMAMRSPGGRVGGGFADAFGRRRGRG